MKNFNSNTIKALHIDSLYLMIKPFSEIGKKAKRNFKVFRQGEEEVVRKYYSKLEKVILVINKFPEFISLIGSTLSHFDDISMIVKSGSKRSYEMYELFEIKSFIYFYRILCKQLKEKDLLDIIPFRDFDALFALLDIDNQESPTFYISTRYSKRYKELKDTYQVLKNEMEESYDNFKQQIIKDLDLSMIEDTITISRMNQILINKLLDSKYFFVDNENFANVVLKIRYSEDIFKKQSKLKDIDIKLQEEANLVRNGLSQKIFECKEEIIRAIEETGKLDLIFAKAIFAKNYHCVIPQIIDKVNDDEIIFECNDMFDLFLKIELNKLNIDYQKISIVIKNNVTVITGSNMGGKTSILKTIGQITFMTQLGIPVPAVNTKTVLFDNIFFSGPVTQEDRADLSSFGFEVFTLQNVINASGFNLFLLDEFGRGTNPSEGQALAQAVMDYFSRKKDTVLVTATHYTPPTKLKNLTHYQMLGLKENFINEFEQENIIDLNSKLKILHNYMDYQPIEVNENNAVPKSALYVAKVLGLDNEIIAKAENICKDIYTQ